LVNKNEVTGQFVDYKLGNDNAPLNILLLTPISKLF